MIYAIEAIGTGFLKFGYHTRSEAKLKNRVQRMQVGCPFELRILTTADWPNDEEKNIHLYLSKSHVRGEWFKMEGGAHVVMAYMKDLRGGLKNWHNFLLTERIILFDPSFRIFSAAQAKKLRYR